jgi:hypothetical protein
VDVARASIDAMRLLLLGFAAFRLSFVLRGKTWQRAEITGEPSTDAPYVAFDLAAVGLSLWAFDPLARWIGFGALGPAWPHALALYLFAAHEVAHCCLLYRYLPVHAVIHFTESVAIVLLFLYGFFDALTWKTALYAGGLAWAVDVAWEYGENIGTEYWDTQAQHGNADLALDLASDALGILAGLAAATWIGLPG